MFHIPARRARPRPAAPDPVGYAPDAPPFGRPPGDEPDPAPPGEYDFERDTTDAMYDERRYGGGR